MRPLRNTVWVGSTVVLATSVAHAAPFLRGDSNEDGSLTIADPVHLLNHLFLGGPAPLCRDVIDADDDGAIRLSDAIFSLDFLFRGGPEPPHPGPFTPGFDLTPTDPFRCGDPPPGDLPGVRLDLSGIPETVAVAEAQAGIVFRYDVVVDEDLSGVVSYALDAGACDEPGASGLKVFERIHGGGESYCLCDVGLCPPVTDVTDLSRGTHEESFEWNGMNWFGPSDFLNPMGPPFPPGRYELEVRASGMYAGPGGLAVLFELSASVEFELVP